MRNLNNKIQIEEIIVKKTNSNFTYNELVRSATAARLGIKNIPTEEQWQCIEILVANVLQPIRNVFGGLRITSGFRSPLLCIALRSSETSNHTKGQAADIEPISTTIRLIDMMNWIYDNLEFRELIAEHFPNGWIHVAFREGANNRQIKLKDKKHNYYRCDMEYINGIYR